MRLALILVGLLIALPAASLETVWGQSVGAENNVAVDRDNDGDPDYYRAVANATSTLEDLQEAIELLTDTGPKYIEVLGTWDSSAMDDASDLSWDTTNMIELLENTTMECAPNARLYGPSLAFWRDRSSATRLISNEDDEGNIKILGCFIENTELLAPFDANTGGTGWGTTSLFGGIHFTGCDNCLAEGNTVRGSPHSGFFMTSSSGTTFRNNSVYGTGEAFNHEGTVTTLAATEPAGETSLDLTATLSNCDEDDWIVIELDAEDALSKDPASKRSLYAAGWVDSTGDPITIRRAAYGTGRNPGLPSQASSGNAVFCTEGDKHGFETYAENDTVAANNSIIGNKAELVPGVAFQIRGVLASEDNCEDDTQVTCWHENTLVAENSAVDVGGELVQVRGSRNSVIRNNTGTRTGGVTFVAALQPCSEPFDDTLGPGNDQRECSINTLLIGNLFIDGAPNTGSKSVVGAFVRFNSGHETVRWDKSNLVDGVIKGNAYGIFGDVGESTLDMVVRNPGYACLADGIATSSLIKPITKPLKGSLDCTWAGIQDETEQPAFFWRGEHTGTLTLDPFIVNGTNGSAVLISPGDTHDIQAPILRNVSIVGHSAGFRGIYATEALADAAVQCDSSYEGVHVITQNATNATDCTFASGTGSTENRCRCNGTTWADWDPNSANDVIEWSNSETSNGGGVFGGTIYNGLGNNSRAFSSGTSAGTVDGFAVVDVTIGKAPTGMLTGDNFIGFDEHNGAFTDLTIQDVRFDGVTNALRFNGFTTDVGEAASETSVIYDIDTPASTCNSGAVWHEIDATSSAFLVCRNSSWVAVD